MHKQVNKSELKPNFRSVHSHLSADRDKNFTDAEINPKHLVHYFHTEPQNLNIVSRGFGSSRVLQEVRVTNTNYSAYRQNNLKYSYNTAIKDQKYIEKHTIQTTDSSKPNKTCKKHKQKSIKINLLLSTNKKMHNSYTKTKLILLTSSNNNTNLKINSEKHNKKSNNNDIRCNKSGGREHQIRRLFADEQNGHSKGVKKKGISVSLQKQKQKQNGKTINVNTQSYFHQRRIQKSQSLNVSPLKLQSRFRAVHQDGISGHKCKKQGMIKNGDKEFTMAIQNIRGDSEAWQERILNKSVQLLHYKSSNNLLQPLETKHDSGVRCPCFDKVPSWISSAKSSQVEGKTKVGVKQQANVLEQEQQHVRKLIVMNNRRKQQVHDRGIRVIITPRYHHT